MFLTSLTSILCLVTHVLCVGYMPQNSYLAFSGFICEDRLVTLGLGLEDYRLNYIIAVSVATSDVLTSDLMF